MRILKTAKNLFIFSGLFWLVLYCLLNFLVNLRAIPLAETIHYYHDIYYFEKLMIEISIQGSGEFVSMNIYSIDNKDEVLPLYESSSEDDFHKLYDMSIVREITGDSFPDGNYFISDIDFDDKIEVVLYDQKRMRSSYNILELDKEGGIERESSLLSIFFVNLICLFRSLISIFFTYIIILTAWIVFAKRFFKH